VVRWLEFKAVAPNLVALEERARDFDAEFIHERREQDTHFNFPDGLLLLRQLEHAPAELITYQRTAYEGFGLAEAEVAAVNDVREVHAMLRGRLGVRTEVEKTRKTLQWRATRIHLDQVYRLGMFVELVGAVDARDEAETAVELRELLVRLGMDHVSSELRGYADLMLAQGSGL
jgi:predicted adenylyl cyclase CyaB